MSARQIAYLYHSNIGNFQYGKDHPMKPKRISMAHELIVNYGLYKHLNVYVRLFFSFYDEQRPHYATREEMNMFHDIDYLKFLELKGEKLQNLSQDPEITEQERARLLLDQKKAQSYKVGGIFDCPTFPGLYDFCQISAGASMDAGILVGENECSVAINWSGGLHHAKKWNSSGFCYVNDIVLSILTLLRYYDRVLYVDIDVHHGDGVEEAFYTTNRVMTLSFHQYMKGFFPGSGNVASNGAGEGKNYALNVPLKPGIDSEMYTGLFKEVVQGAFDKFRPDVICMQCGADSIVHDKLGSFNNDTRAHGECVEFVLSRGVPVVLLGGGGYTIENVARCWTNETAIALGIPIEETLPKCEKLVGYFPQGSKLHVDSKPNVMNQNTVEEIDKIKETLFGYLKDLQPTPQSEFNSLLPPEKMYTQSADMEIEISCARESEEEYILQNILSKSKGKQATQL